MATISLAYILKLSYCHKNGKDITAAPNNALFPMTNRNTKWKVPFPFFASRMMGLL